VSFLLKKVFNEDFKPYLIIDFIKEGEGMTNEELLSLTRDKRDEMERRCIEKSYLEIFNLLPVTDEKRKTYLQRAKEYVNSFHWNNVFPMLSNK
jgi:hypothetical protein